MTETNDGTLTVGLLMEAAQVQQRSADNQLERLRLLTQDLDAVVRDEIRRVLVEELQQLGAETRRAMQSLEKIRRGASLRTALWSVGVTVLCAAIPVGVAEIILPSTHQIDALRAQRDTLNMNVAELLQHGGRVELKHCGNSARLCVRVDTRAPKYGEKADYYVVAGY